MNVNIANVEMAAAWQEEGEGWARHWQRYDEGIARHHTRLLETAAIEPGERVLDIGCGNGASTRAAARASGDGLALGVDLSLPMLERARELARSEGIVNIRFEQADAQVHPFEPEAFDVAISRFGAMFFGDRAAAFANIRRALQPRGRLALLSWRRLEDNEWLQAIRASLAVGRDLPSPPVGAPGPFGLADADATRAILTGAGLGDVEVVAVDERFWAGADADDAFEFVRQIGPVRGLTQDLDETDRTRAFENLRATIEAHETDEGVVFGSGACCVLQAGRDLRVEVPSG